MKRSVSSVLAERRRQRRAATPKPIQVRHVKFTPAEMAYEVPADTSGFVPVGRGPAAVFAKPSDARTAKLDPDVGRVFKSDELVNEVLRRAMSLMEIGGRLKSPPPGPRRKRKSA